MFVGFSVFHSKVAAIVGRILVGGTLGHLLLASYLLGSDWEDHGGKM